MNVELPIIDARKTGTSLVFSAIRQTSPVPRIDIAKATGLSPATVTSITADLIAKGLIQEVRATCASGTMKRGRPRVNLKIRGDAHMVAGMQLSDKLSTVTILDFDGKHVADYSNATTVAVRSARQTVDFLEQNLIAALDSEGLVLSDISGVGLGIAGFIDVPTGHVHWSPILAERDVPLQQLLRDRFKIPTFLDNDANLVAIAEQRFGLGKKALNFVVVTVEQGVGMGIVIDGNLYRGMNGRGAELGHTKVHLDGALCRCGQRGCLEAYVGDYALLREANTARELVAGTSVEHQMEVLLEAAKSGDGMAESIIRRAGRMFAMGLANVVNIFAPELIILSGERMQYDFLYDDRMIEDMQKSIVQAGGTPTEVKVHKWGDQMWAMGAAAFAIDGIAEMVLADSRSNAA